MSISSGVALYTAATPVGGQPWFALGDMVAVVAMGVCTAVCGPEVNTYNQPVFGGSGGRWQAASVHAAIGARVEGGGYATPSAGECALHFLLPSLRTGCGGAMGVEGQAWASRGVLCPRG